ncbi:MAG: hypothetical protein QF535_12570, partial [Anaerolineales bacterium]|nr:hypothetical protein [Anaerolineales bacterium]
MAVTETRSLYNPQIEALTEKYTTAMGKRAATPFTEAQIGLMAPKVAQQTGLQRQATDLTTAGLGAYSPYVTAAGTQLGAAGTQQGLAETGLAGIGAQYADPARQAAVQAQGTLGGVSPYITAAGQGLATAGGTGALGLGTAGTELTGAGTAMGGAQQYVTDAAGLTGPMTGAQLGTIDRDPSSATFGQTITPTLAAGSYMSPYQSQVIDTTLAEFDKQAAMRQQGISDAAVAMGGFGGGREGVMQSEYQTQSDKNRALLQAQMLQQGFGQGAAL